MRINFNVDGVSSGTCEFAGHSYMATINAVVAVRMQYKKRMFLLGGVLNNKASIRILQAKYMALCVCAWSSKKKKKKKEV
jgi:hypothetical protein